MIRNGSLVLGLFLAASLLGCDSTSSTAPPKPPDEAPDMAPPVMLPTIADGLHSGERLKVAYYTAPGGLTFPGALIDVTLGELTCTPRFAADGKWRCLPVFLDVPTQYFADAGCTQPLYARARETPAFITLETVSAAQVFFVSPFSQSSGAVYYLSGVSCNSRTVPNGLAMLSLFTAGAVVPLHGFAELQLNRGM